MPKNEKTSKKVQRIAAKGIKKPESLTPEEVKAVCASALTQSADTTASEEIAPSYIQDRIDWVTKPPVCETHSEKFIYEYDDTTMSRYCRSCDRDEEAGEVAPID